MTFACKWKPLSGNFVVRFFKRNTYIYGWSRVKNFFSVQGNKKRKTQTNIQVLFIFDVILEMLNLSLLTLIYFRSRFKINCEVFPFGTSLGQSFIQSGKLKNPDFFSLTHELVQVFLFLTGCKIIEIYIDWLDIVAALFQIDRFIGRHWF